MIEEPWVTVAETSEFILSLMCAGYVDEAKRLLVDVLNISDKDGIPYGRQYEENIFGQKKTKLDCCCINVECGLRS